MLVLTTFEDEEYVYGALRAGASGFLLKDTEPADLIAAVKVVAGAEALLAPAVTRRLIERLVAADTGRDPKTVLPPLTEREVDVLAKLGARGRAQLVMLAYRSGLARS